MGTQDHKGMSSSQASLISESALALLAWALQTAGAAHMPRFQSCCGAAHPARPWRKAPLFRTVAPRL